MHGGGKGTMGAPPPPPPPPPPANHSQAHAHHHLAHSVRLAFGMTPIHPNPSTHPHSHQHPQHSHSSGALHPTTSGPGVPPASIHSHSNTHAGRAWSSGVSTPNRAAFGAGLTANNNSTVGGSPGHATQNPSSLSMPVSRAGSPPIKLAPLRISSPTPGGHAGALTRPGVERRDSGSGSGEGGHGSGSGGGGGGVSPVGEHLGSKGIVGGDGAGEPMEDVRQEDNSSSGKVGELVGAAPQMERVALPGFSEIEAATRGLVPA